jgi:PAS domain S-box-containing protein
MTQRGKATAEQDSLAFLAGGGEMGERTRSFDWSATPVGPASGWPQSLKTAVSICLGSRYPIVIWWAKQTLTQFYNDAYIPILGVTKHPGWLGRSGGECWSEIWPIMAPMWDSVFATGEATWSEDFLYVLDRNTPREEAYFTFSYSPIPDDAGAVGGIFCACNETTGRVIGERRLRTLRDLGRTVAEAKTAADACEVAARTLTANPADIPFALIYLLDTDGRQACLAAATGIEAGSGAAPQRIDLRERSAAWPLHRVYETTAVEVVTDLPARFGNLPGGAWPESPQTALVLPIASPGQTRPTGLLVTGLSPRRVVDADYRSFFDLIAGHIGTAIANARAYEEERKRAEALAELDRAKTAFFSNVSHEFRTPLTLMLGPVEDLLAKSHTELTPSAAGQLEVVNRNGLRLLRLVNTLLDFSRIEAGRVRAVFQPTDLAAFTADLASVFRSACERAGLRLVVDCPRLAEPVFVDRDMWEKVVLNLLSNAFKFTFEGEIAVTLRQTDEPGASATGGPAVELRVRDTGTGIPAEEMPRLFERFHRIENARGRTHEGSGIGLALVQELVKLHGGSVTAESVVGQGTTFTISVPLGSAHLPPDQIGEGRTFASTATGAAPYVEEALRWLPSAEKGEGGRRKDEGLAFDLPVHPPSFRLHPSEDDRPRVLVADDNADMRQYVTRLLAEHYRIDTVPDGAAALAAVRQHTPDLILTDVMMPRLDGFGLLRELRADPRTRDLPVIMLSARAGEESRVEGMEAGADDYLVKPFGARELLARVTAHLQMARMRRETSQSLRQGEERLRMALNAARMVAWQLDPFTGKVVISDNAADVFGLPPGSMLENSKQGFALVHPDDMERHRAIVTKAVEECGNYLSQFRMIRPDNGQVIWLEERGQAICGESKKTERLVGVDMDITDRKRAEDALKEADRRKDEFLATLAHELRNPLAPLRNGLQVMKLTRNNSEAFEQTRAMMERQLGQMVRLIDDLLDMSRISQGKIELKKERVELAKVVQQAVETSRPLIESSGHELTINVPPQPIFVDADVTRLAQVLANLLNNAAKYTPRGGRVTLTVERQGSDAVVSVRDTGVGSPAHMLPKVFEMFTQVDRSLEHSQGGLGIGLSLVKKLVEMHGGSVEARSEGHGMGSEFVVCLPVVLSLAGPRRDEDSGAGAAARRRILVVDDNRDAAISLAMMLRLMGNETQTAHDGQEALDLAAAFRPDVILLDIGMPKLNGYDAARRIRQEPWGKNTVLVAVTGWGQDDDRRRSRESGFNFHIVKPVEPATLEKLLAGLQATTG